MTVTDVSGFIVALKNWIGNGCEGERGEGDCGKFYYQNQLYGCFVILEMLAEGNMGGVDQLRFEDIGRLYGFYDGSGCVIPKSITNERNTAFRKIWEWAFKEIGEGRRIDDVDRVEREVFTDIDDLIWFREAVQMGVLSEETMIGVRKMFAAGAAGAAGTATTSDRKRFRKTRKRC